MLVVGFNSENGYHFSHKLDVDLDLDSPRKIHDMLKKQAGKEMKGEGFSVVLVFDDDGDEAAVYESDEDYDLADDVDEDDTDSDDDEDADALHEEENEDD